MGVSYYYIYWDYGEDIDSVFWDIDYNFKQTAYYINYTLGGIIGGMYTALDNMDNDISTLWVHVFSTMRDDLATLNTNLNTLWNRVFGTLQTEIDGIQQNITRIYNEYLTGLVADVDRIDTDIDILWSEVFTNIDADIITLSDNVIELQNRIDNIINVDLTGLEGIISDELRPALTGLTDRINSVEIGLNTRLNIINTEFTNEISRLDQTIAQTTQNLYDTIDVAVYESEQRTMALIYDTATDFSDKLADLDVQLSNALEKTAQDLTQNMDNLERDINQRITTVVDSVTAGMIELQAEINIQEQELTLYFEYPIGLLLAILTDKNGVYSQHADLWQRFVTTLLG